MLKETKKTETKKLSELGVPFWVHEKALIRTDDGWKFPHELSRKESIMTYSKVEDRIIFSMVSPTNKYKIPYKGNLNGVRLYKSNVEQTDLEIIENDDTGKSRKRKVNIKNDNFTGDILFKPADNITTDRVEVKSLIDKRTYKAKTYPYDGFLYGFDVKPVVAYEYILSNNELTNIEYNLI